MNAKTPQAVQACHELIRWLIPQLDNFPRQRRFTLGERLEQTMLEVLERLLEAAYTRAKQPALQRPNLLRITSDISIAPTIKTRTQRVCSWSNPISDGQ